jgi:hypothetical protein
MRACALALLVVTAVPIVVGSQQQPVQFGGGYSGLDARRQHLVDNWVARFAKTTGQQVEPGPFYDDVLSLSAKTTFDAVTHALVTTRLTDRSGAALGDALALVARIDAVRGEVAGAPGDRQFRMYVRLTDTAIDLLDRSQQFRRGADNSVYHKGYPINYRALGVPSIQISIALDKRRADIDVDYRSSSFPVGLFNGHLTASNSDVRAGSNYDRHLNQWSGFQNWWRGFFGVRKGQATEPTATSGSMELPKVPRAGKASIDKMVNDFLTAWLVEGNVVAAMGYISERSYACLARDTDDPSTFDRGVAPFQLMGNLKSARDSIGSRSSLDGLVVGTRLVKPELRVMSQPHHAQFVIYSVPDDVAASFDCESQLSLGDPAAARRVYGNYFGATFYIDGHGDTPVALLWAREQGYWKIVSWRVGGDDARTDATEAVASPKVVRVAADPTLVTAARAFLDNWLVRHDYDTAFGYISPKAYACYDLERGEPATTPEEAGRKLRASLESSGSKVNASRSLADILTAAEPVHAATRIMDHQDSRVFTLTSIPNAFADALECAARASASPMPDSLPLEYGNGFGMMVRFKTRSGDAPVLRLLWRKENAAWKITSYIVELP